MKFFILGGNGYIGSKVVHLLLNEGHELSCTKRQNSDLARVSDVYERIDWTSTDIEEIAIKMKKSHYDYVLNLACNYGRSDVLYGDVLEANIEFPLRVLNAAVENSVNHYLTIGTGLPSDLNMYSFSKKMFSDFGRFYVEKHNIGFCSLLLQMFYGADEPEDRFLPMIIRKMIKGEPVDTTRGTQKRDIISVEDVVKAIMMVIHSDLKGYNEIPVGTGISPSISEIIDYIWELTDKKSMIHKGVYPMRDNEPDCVADVSVIKKIGEWNPIPWKTGIANMIEKMREDSK